VPVWTAESGMCPAAWRKSTPERERGNGEGEGTLAGGILESTPVDISSASSAQLRHPGAQLCCDSQIRHFTVEMYTAAGHTSDENQETARHSPQSASVAHTVLFDDCIILKYSSLDVSLWDTAGAASLALIPSCTWPSDAGLRRTGLMLGGCNLGTLN
jgi:hypothetical protein